MKSVLLRSIVIALSVSLLATVLTSVVLYTYTAQSSVTGFTQVVIGIEAVKSYIQAFGMRAYATSVFLAYTVSSAVLFVAAFAQGLWFLRSPVK